MSVTSDLEKLSKDLKQIESKAYQAVRIRIKILARIAQACEALKINPNDEAARRSLVLNLERERRFLDIVRKGIKNASLILKITSGELKRIKADPNLKVQVNDLLTVLTNTLEFASKKIKLIERRIKDGERLENKEYSLQSLNKFMKTLGEEADLDRELSDRLRGIYVERITQMDVLLKMRFTKNVIGAGALGAALPAAGAALAISGGGASMENPLGSIVIMLIGTFAFMKAMYIHEAFAAEKEQEERSGRMLGRS